MQASPWFLEVIARAPRWHRTVWLCALLVLSLSVGWALATCMQGACVDRRTATGRTLTQLRRGIHMARLSAGSDAGCPEALAAATVGGVLEDSIDAWGQPIEIRCYGDTLVLRSHAAAPSEPFDDVVLVAPMTASTSREASHADELR